MALVALSCPQLGEVDPSAPASGGVATTGQVQPATPILTAALGQLADTRSAVSPAPPAFLIVDLDFDGIDDAYENLLLDQYAPEVRLHSGETNMPADADWSMAQTHMRFSHKLCPDHGIVSYGFVDANTITQQNHRNTNWHCGHTGNTLYSDQYKSTDHRKGFFLEYPYGSGPSGAWLGAPDQRDWVAYGHVFPCGDYVNSGLGEAYVVQYWFHYAYNDWHLGFNHEGDWESIAVVVYDNDKVAGPQAPYTSHYWYFQHHTKHWYAIWEVSTVPGTPRPIVYVANGSHASYPGYDNSCGFSVCRGSTLCSDRCDGGGVIWNTRDTVTFGGIRNLGEKHFPRPGMDWIRYTGRWGEIGEFSVTSGPHGPAQQAESWHINGIHEICGNGIDDNVDGIIDNQLCSPTPDLYLVEGNPALWDSGAAGYPVVHPGDGLRVRCELANFGAGTGTSFLTELGLSLDRVEDPSDIALPDCFSMTGMAGFTTLGPLPTWYTTVPLGTPPARYYVTTRTDVNNTVAEGVAGELNNFYVSDTFVTVVSTADRADNFDIGATTLSFTILGGTWDASRGYYVGTAPFGYQTNTYALTPVVNEGHVLEFDFSLESFGLTSTFNMAAVLRYLDWDSVLRVEIGHADWGYDYVELQEKNPSSPLFPLIIDSAPVSTDLTTDYHHVEILDCQAGITVFIDGKVVLSTPSHLYSDWYPANQVGLWVDNGASVAFDNLLVTPASTDHDGDGWTRCEGDCNDWDAAVNPGASENCGNEIDDDCDGTINEGCGSSGSSPIFSKDPPSTFQGQDP